MYKGVHRSQSGDIERVEDTLQRRPTAASSAIESVQERTIALYQSGVKGKTDLEIHTWQRKNAEDLPSFLRTIKRGINPILQDILRFIDGGIVGKIKQATVWQEWATKLGFDRLDLTNTTEARRDLLDLCILSTSAQGFCQPIAYLAAGFDAAGRMRLLYVGKLRTIADLASVGKKGEMA